MNATYQSGFTLWELLMTLLVAGIVLGFGVPNFMEFQRNNAVVAAANELVTGTLMARTEAVKRQVPVTLCLSSNPTDPAPTCEPDPIADSDAHGFIIWADENGNVDANGAPILTDGTDGNGAVDAGETVLMQSAAPGGALRVSANCGHIGYGPNGFPRAVAGLCAPAIRSFLFCDDRGNRATAGDVSTARVVRIDAPGRGQVLTQVADVGNEVGGNLAGVAPSCP
jgi:type IV fimbrial biogenesis protein FimT